jgi:hypothetical protein
MLLIIGGAGGYKLSRDIEALRTAKPIAPPEVTDALDHLRTALDRQRTETSRQLQQLQTELASVKTAQENTPQPDIAASLAPLQQQLSALAAQVQALSTRPAPTTEAEPTTPPVTAEQPDPSPAPVAAEPIATTNADPFSALRLAVTSGKPYAAELAAVTPQLPTHLAGAAATLARTAEAGVPSAQQLRAQQLENAPTATLPGWAEKVNARLAALVRITPSKPAITADEEKDLIAAQEAREAAMVALATIEAGRQ